MHPTDSKLLITYYFDIYYISLFSVLIGSGGLDNWFFVNAEGMTQFLFGEVILI